jgi:hypothetical protein
MPWLVVPYTTTEVPCGAAPTPLAARPRSAVVYGLPAPLFPRLTMVAFFGVGGGGGRLVDKSVVGGDLLF